MYYNLTAPSILTFGTRSYAYNKFNNRVEYREKPSFITKLLYVNTSM